MFDTIRYIDDPAFDVKGKRVLMRVDFNVPRDDSGAITNDKRIREALPSINLLRKKGGRVILLSHLGRPKQGPDPKYSLKSAAARLGELLEEPVDFAPDCVGDIVDDKTRVMRDGDVLLLENVRFHERETKDCDAFGAELARCGDVFVNDAFGSSHRAHGSVVGVAKTLPHAAGLLIKRELRFFAPLLSDPRRPYAAVLGGAKVADKIGVIEALIERVNTLIIGGGMAYTFLAAQGQPIGLSLLDKEHVAFARGMLVVAKQRGVELLLPADHIVSTSLDEESARVEKTIPDAMAAFDIGPETMKRFSDALRPARTIVFNGPMGVFEKSRYSSGTKAVLEAMAEAHAAGATVVVGGGDSAAAVEAFEFEHQVSHVSTGGGASLELLEGRELPGIAVLAQ